METSGTRSNVAKILSSTLRQYLIPYQDSITDSSGRVLSSEQRNEILAMAHIYDNIGELSYSLNSYQLVKVAAQQTQNASEVVSTAIALLQANQVMPLGTSENHWMLFRSGIPLIKDYIITRKVVYNLEKSDQKYQELTTKKGTSPGDMAMLKLAISNTRRVLQEATTGSKNPFITYVVPKYHNDIKRGQKEANQSVKTLLDYCELTYYVNPTTEVVMDDEDV